MSEPIVSLVALALLETVMKSSLLLLLALAATGAMKGSSASMRHIVWAAAIAGAIMLPLLSPFIPVLRVPLPADLVAGIEARSLTAPRFEAGSPPTSFAGPAEVRASRSTPSAPIGPILLILVWAAGVLLMSAKLLVSACQVRRLARRASPIGERAWLDLTAELARKLGIGGCVTLMRGKGGRIPMTWGVTRPVVWLPLEAEGWTEERRRVVLAHELAHVKRRDAVTQWIGHVARAIYWFNPIVWIATRRLHEERERACDDAVLRIGTPANRYAEHLLQVVRTLGGRSAPVAAIAMARPSRLEGRIRAVLDRSVARGGATTGRAVVVFTLSTSSVLAIAALRPAVASEVPSSATKVIRPHTPWEGATQGAGEAARRTRSGEVVRLGDRHPSGVRGAAGSERSPAYASGDRVDPLVDPGSPREPSHDSSEEDSASIPPGDVGSARQSIGGVDENAWTLDESDMDSGGESASSDAAATSSASSSASSTASASSES